MKHNELNHPANNKSSYWGVKVNASHNGVLLQISNGRQDSRKEACIILDRDDVWDLITSLAVELQEVDKPTETKKATRFPECWRCGAPLSADESICPSCAEDMTMQETHWESGL